MGGFHNLPYSAKKNEQSEADEGSSNLLSDFAGPAAFEASDDAVREVHPQRRSSRFAVAAVVLSICGQLPIYPFLLLHMASLVCCLLAISEIRRQRRYLKGTGLVVIAITLTFVWAFNTNWASGDLALLPKIKAKNEQHLEQTLKVLRAAIAKFHTDTGVNPSVLTDLIARDEKTVKAQIPKGSYHGPYLHYGLSKNGSGIPSNPVNGGFLDNNIHWIYNNATGEVRSAVDGITADGRHYRNL